MKKYKKLKSASFALILSLLLVGCGENASEVNEITKTTSGTAEQAQITVNTKGEKETTAEEDTAAETTEEEAAETELEDLPPDESLFEYYDLLNEEFEKYGVTSPMAEYKINKYFSSNEQTIVIYGFKEETVSSRWVGDYTVDVDTKFTYDIENKTRYSNTIDSDRHDKVVCNDNAYYTNTSSWWSNRNIYVCKYDGTSLPMIGGFEFNGDELWDSTGYLNSIFSQPDGTVFLSFSREYNLERIYLMVSPDYETLTQLPKPTIEVEHGFTETRDYDILACYNNMLFVNADDIGFCCIDANNLTWEKLNFDLGGEAAFDCKSVGRYLLFKYTIYDMETKEVVVHNENFPVSFAETYYGGKYNVAIKNNKWYFFRCASDGSEVDWKYYESYDLGDQSSSKCTPITDKYYIYEDNYGYFLRAYETGEQWEETIYLKDDRGKIIYEE